MLVSDFVLRISNFPASRRASVRGHLRPIAGDRFPADFVHDRPIMKVRADTIATAVRIDDAEDFAFFPLMRQDLRNRREAVFRQAVEPGRGPERGWAPVQPGTFGTRIGVTKPVSKPISRPRFFMLMNVPMLPEYHSALHGRTGLAGPRQPAARRAGAFLRPGQSSWPGHRCAAYPAGPGRRGRSRAGSSRCPPRRTRSDTPARCRRICSRTK